jgi:hypothetical protein
MTLTLRIASHSGNLALNLRNCSESITGEAPPCLAHATRAEAIDVSPAVTQEWRVAASFAG